MNRIPGSPVLAYLLLAIRGRKKDFAAHMDWALTAAMSKPVGDAAACGVHRCGVHRRLRPHPDAPGSCNFIDQGRSHVPLTPVRARAGQAPLRNVGGLADDSRAGVPSGSAFATTVVGR